MRRLMLVVCLLLACSRGEQPDVLLISIDTLRADHLGCYGASSPRTPHIDALAAQGVLYEQCQSPVPITLPAHASILTGKLPSRHGVRNNATYQLPAAIPTLAERLQAAGYQTGAFVAALPLAARFGLTRGFDHYDDELGGSREQFGLEERAAEEVLRAALAWLRERDPGRPVFLWVHFFEPHSPYLPPAPFDQQYRARPYEGEVAAADAALGQLLAGFAGVRSRARITALTSDHGEGLGEHGEATHAIFLYQTTLRVPLILHAPDRWPGGLRVEEPVGLIDLAPTLLAALELDPAALDADGVVLRPGGAAPTRRPLYSESLYGMEAYRWSPLFALREGPRKVIRSRIARSFDLADDPKELADLGATREAWAVSLLNQLDRRVLASAAQTQGLQATRQPTPEETEALAALGYVGGLPEASGPRDDDRLLRMTTELPDATERHAEFDRTHEAEQLIEAGRFEAAAQILDELLQGSPQNVWARMLYAQALGEAGQTDAAIAAYEQASTLRPNWLEIQVNLARLQVRAQRVAQAQQHYEQALQLSAHNLALRLEAAGFLQRSERLTQARLLLEAGLAEHDDAPSRAQLEAALARVFYQSGELDPGRQHLERARALADDDALRTLAALYLRAQGRRAEIIDLLSPFDAQCGPEALVYLGEALQVAGRPAEAAERYRRALARDESLHLAHNNLAWALAVDLGDAQAALPHAERAIELAPDQPDYHDSYLEVLTRLGRDADARAHLAQALARFPDHPSLRARADSR